jgi:hypothetical protein
VLGAKDGSLTVNNSVVLGTYTQAASQEVTTLYSRHPSPTWLTHAEWHVKHVKDNIYTIASSMDDDVHIGYAGGNVVIGPRAVQWKILQASHSKYTYVCDESARSIRSIPSAASSLPIVPASRLWI